MLHLIVTFVLFCSAFGTGVDCPASAPQDRTSCPLTGNAWMTCSYNRTTCCPGTPAAKTVYQQVADCRNGTWSVGVLSCSCPAAPPLSTCTESMSDLDSPCTGDVTCRYGSNMTCCDGSVQFNGKIVTCSNGAWQVGIADGCLFGCAGQTPSTCPASESDLGPSCSGDVQCRYGSNMTCCDGSVQFNGKIVTCSNGAWQVGIADGCGFGCVGQEPSTCPSSPSGFGSSCSGDVTCKFLQNMTCCNGAVQSVGKIVRCADGEWLTAAVDGCMFGCDNQCPTSAPTNGAFCQFETSVTCKYSSGTAKCVAGKWAVDTGSVFTSFCPKTAPTNGQTCSPGASAYIRCQYNSKTCPCGGQIYQTDAWCRSTKLVWDVTAVSCPACLVQEN